MSNARPKDDWTQFKMEVEIKRPVSVVFKAWTDDKEIVKTGSQQQAVGYRTSE